MVAYARAGRRHRALRQFFDCRRALVEQLVVEPGAETARLQQRILAGSRSERDHAPVTIA
jgi:DNA-binding SARP family transcriptional activator